MLQEMKKKAIKRAVVIAIVLFIIGGFFTTVAISSRGGLFVDKKDIYSAKVDDIRNAKYAKINIDKYNLYGIFTEEYETKNGTKTTQAYYCLVLVGQDDDQRFMAVKVPSKYKKKLDKIQEEYTDLDNGVESDAHTVIKIQGKMVKMKKTSQLYGYFKDYVKEYDYTDEDIPFVTLGMCLESRDAQTPIIFFVMAAALFIAGIVIILVAVIGGGAGKIKKKMLTMSQVEIEHMEYDYQSSYMVNKNFKIGKEFTYIMNGLNGNFIPNKEIIWAYLNTIDHRTNGIHTGTTYNIILTDINKKAYTASVANENVASDVLQRYSDISKRIVIGYDKELKNMINRDFNAFLNIAYNSHEESLNQQEGYSEDY